jgi:Holliday junction DNA helicase RuvA
MVGRLLPGVDATADAADALAAIPSGSINEDAVSALVNLDYKRVEAYGAVARVTQRLGEGATFDAVVRAALQELAR